MKNPGMCRLVVSGRSASASVRPGTTSAARCASCWPPRSTAVFKIASNASPCGLTGSSGYGEPVCVAAGACCACAVCAASGTPSANPTATTAIVIRRSTTGLLSAFHARERNRRDAALVELVHDVLHVATHGCGELDLIATDLINLLREPIGRYRRGRCDLRGADGGALRTISSFELAAHHRDDALLELAQIVLADASGLHSCGWR